MLLMSAKCKVTGYAGFYRVPDMFRLQREKGRYASSFNLTAAR